METISSLLTDYEGNLVQLWCPEKLPHSSQGMERLFEVNVNDSVN